MDGGVADGASRHGSDDCGGACRGGCGNGRPDQFERLAQERFPGAEILEPSALRFAYREVGFDACGVHRPHFGIVSLKRDGGEFVVVSLQVPPFEDIHADVLAVGAFADERDLESDAPQAVHERLARRGRTAGGEDEQAAEAERAVRQIDAVIVAVVEFLVETFRCRVVFLSEKLGGLLPGGHALLVVAVELEDFVPARRAADAGGEHVRRNHMSAAVVAQVEHEVGDPLFPEPLYGVQQIVVVGRVEAFVNDIPHLRSVEHLGADDRRRVQPLGGDPYGACIGFVARKLDLRAVRRGEQACEDRGVGAFRGCLSVHFGDDVAAPESRPLERRPGQNARRAQPDTARQAAVMVGERDERVAADAVVRCRRGFRDAVVHAAPCGRGLRARGRGAEQVGVETVASVPFVVLPVERVRAHPHQRMVDEVVVWTGVGDRQVAFRLPVGFVPEVVARERRIRPGIDGRAVGRGSLNHLETRREEVSGRDPHGRRAGRAAGVGRHGDPERRVSFGARFGEHLAPPGSAAFGGPEGGGGEGVRFLRSRRGDLFDLLPGGVRYAGPAGRRVVARALFAAGRRQEQRQQQDRGPYGGWDLFHGVCFRVFREQDNDFSLTTSASAPFYLRIFISSRR